MRILNKNTFKLALRIIFLVVFSFLAIKYYEYYNLKKYIKNYKEVGVEYRVSYEIDRYFSRFHILRIKEKKDFQSIVDNSIRNSFNQFVFDQYPFGIKIDTMKSS